MRHRFPLLFALLLPLVFVHAEYQPSFSVSLAGSDATVYLTDLAVLAIGALGFVAGRALGLAPLAAARGIWISSALFLLVVAAGLVVGAATTDGYRLADNALTAAKLAEYALLALAAPLVFRSRGDLRPLLAAVALWAAAATLVGLLQFLGLVDEFEGRRPGQREPSFLGIHDFATLSLAVAVVTGGVVAIRTADTRPLLDALGIERERSVATDPEASWQQRFALSYIGARIFLDHPLTGVGWLASEQRYAPYLDDTRGRFPDLPEVALPSPEHEWGVQNAYVQAASDLGVLGLAAFLALFLVPLRAAWRVGAAAAVPILWLLVAMGVWIGIGLVAGIPLVALTWLGVGLAAASQGWRDDV